MLTLEQKATNFETYRHIERVRNLLNVVAMELLRRGERHDQSKLSFPEVKALTEQLPRLSLLTYGSEEYCECLKEMAPAVDHHYQHNRHHPEHHVGGISGMDLVDLIEMFCDWKAASERHKDGNLVNSIDINAMRFSIDPQLVMIFRNTVGLFGYEELDGPETAKIS